VYQELQRNSNVLLTCYIVDVLLPSQADLQAHQRLDVIVIVPASRSHRCRFTDVATISAERLNTSSLTAVVSISTGMRQLLSDQSEYNLIILGRTEDETLQSSYRVTAGRRYGVAVHRGHHSVSYSQLGYIVTSHHEGGCKVRV